jgi:hypothetical protein
MRKSRLDAFLAAVLALAPCVAACGTHADIDASDGAEVGGAAGSSSTTGSDGATTGSGGASGGTGTGGSGGAPTCPATCDIPAGTVELFASVRQAQGSVVGRWQICSDSSKPPAQPADSIGIELEATGIDSDFWARGNLYYLVSGPVEPIRSGDAGHQFVYRLGVTEPSIYAGVSLEGSLQNGSLRYAPCPRRMEIEWNNSGIRSTYAPL